MAHNPPCVCSGAVSYRNSFTTWSHYHMHDKRRGEDSRQHCHLQLHPFNMSLHKSCKLYEATDIPHQAQNIPNGLPICSPFVAGQGRQSWAVNFEHHFNAVKSPDNYKNTTKKQKPGNLILCLVRHAWMGKSSHLGIDNQAVCPKICCSPHPHVLKTQPGSGFHLSNLSNAAQSWTSGAGPASYTPDLEKHI